MRPTVFFARADWTHRRLTHRPKTDIVVAVERIVDVAVDGARIDMIVQPRAATQVRRREPRSLRCPRNIP
jgi:hypothetical protein